MIFSQRATNALRNMLLGASLVVASSSVLAHVSLESANPAINATVASQPNSLRLNFGSEVMLMNVKLKDAQSKTIALNYQVNHDLKKSFEVALPKLKSGKYTVIWTTMGMDGHHMSGEYNFTLKSPK